MLKRAWIVVAGGWAAIVLYAGTTRSDGIMEKDLILALAPIAVGWLLARAGRFVVTGSPIKRPRAIPYRP